jgi:hypothetical protein
MLQPQQAGVRPVWVMLHQVFTHDDVYEGPLLEAALWVKLAASNQSPQHC